MAIDDVAPKETVPGTVIAAWLDREEQNLVAQHSNLPIRLYSIDKHNILRENHEGWSDRAFC